MGFHAATTNCASSRHSILRLWRGPSPRAYSSGTISHGLSCRYGELCLSEALYPAPLTRPFSKGLLADDYLTWAFMPLRRIVPLRGTLSCAFGAALLQGPTRQGLSHMGFHAATTNCASLRHSILRLWRGPSPRAYSRDYLTWAFMPLRRVVPLRGTAILSLWRGPSPRAYSRGTISHGLSCRYNELCRFEALQSSPFGAALLQGPTRRGLSHMGFYTATAYSLPSLFAKSS